MRRTVIVTMMMAIGSMLTTTAHAAEETPTYNEEIAAILLDNCASCHRPNQIAPMSLLSYKDVRPWARAIKSKIESREMPPWFADPRFGEFSNDTSLSDRQIATIVAWVDGGAPEGDGLAPEPPFFSADGWSHPNGLDPDYVLDFPVELQIDADGELPNFNLFTPLPFDDVMWVSATQVRPGNLPATHHIVTQLFEIPEGMKVGAGTAWPGGPKSEYALVRDPDADHEAIAAARKEREENPEDEAEESADEAAERAQSRAGFGAYMMVL